MVLNGIIIITQAVRAARDITGEVHKYAQDNPPKVHGEAKKYI